MACARHDSAGDRAILFTEVFCPTEDPCFDPTTWNVVVTRQDGGIVVAERKLQWGNPYRIVSISGVRMGNRASVEPMNTDWAPGRYSIQYTNALGRTAYNLSITLQ